MAIIALIVLVPPVFSFTVQSIVVFPPHQQLPLELSSDLFLKLFQQPVGTVSTKRAGPDWCVVDVKRDRPP